MVSSYISCATEDFRWLDFHTKQVLTCKIYRRDTNQAAEVCEYKASQHVSIRIPETCRMRTQDLIVQTFFFPLSSNCVVWTHLLAV